MNPDATIHAVANPGVPTLAANPDATTEIVATPKLDANTPPHEPDRVGLRGGARSAGRLAPVRAYHWPRRPPKICRGAPG